jgi:predicted nucleic acid-binding protein
VSPAFVVDASMALAWCFADETTSATAQVQDRLQGESALVPSHWFLEVGNALAMAERRNRIQPTVTDAFIQLLRRMQLVEDDEAPDRAFDEILSLARSHQLTVYDAAYLDLSLRHGLPLASLDEDLRAAASQLGVQLLGK